MSESILVAILIAIPFLAVAGIIAVIVVSGKRRKKAESLKTPTILYKEMTSALRQWGILLIIVNGAAFVFGIVGGVSPPGAAAIGGFLPAILMGRLFLTVPDASLFLAYAVVLVIYALMDLAGIGELTPVVIPIILLRLMFALVFFNNYRRYIKAQHAYSEESGVTLAVSRERSGLNDRLTEFAGYGGIIASIGIVSMVGFSIVYGLATQSLNFPGWTLILEQFFLSLGIFSAGTALAVRIERLDPGGFSIFGGVLVGIALFLVLVLQAYTSVLRITGGNPTVTESQLQPDSSGQITVLEATPTPSYLPQQSSMFSLFPSSSPETHSLFGWDVAIDGDALLVTEPHFDRPGEAFIYRRTGSSKWELEEHISSPSAVEAFGFRGDLNDNLAAVGGFTGGTYIYQWLGGRWNQTGVFDASDVLVSDGRVIKAGNRSLHAPEPDIYNAFRAITVFAPNKGGGWVQEAELSIEPRENYTFPYYLGADDDIILATAVRAGYDTLGVMVIFRRTGEEWEVVNEIDLEHPSYIWDMAISGDTIAISYHTEVVLLRDTTPETRDWIDAERTSITLPPPPAGKEGPFVLLDIDGDTLLVSYYFGDLPEPSGMVFVFTRDLSNNPGWNWTETLTLSTVSDPFGSAIALSDDTYVVSATIPEADYAGEGLVYLFTAP
jgi:hypothetical protein